MICGYHCIYKTRNAPLICYIYRLGHSIDNPSAITVYKETRYREAQTSLITYHVVVIATIVDANIALHKARDPGSLHYGIRQ